MHVLKCALMIGLSALPCMAQQPAAADQPQKMQIVLEQKVGKTIRVVNPQHVFKTRRSGALPLSAPPSTDSFT